MLIREYHESDLHTLRAIHAAQGFDYALPDLSNPLFVTKLVLSDANAAGGGTCPGLAGSPPSSSSGSGHEDHAEIEKAAALKGGATHDRILGAAEIPSTGREGNCRILGAALLRLTAEAYLLLDPGAGTPRERWQWLLALHAAAERDAWRRGLEDVHAWLPSTIAKKFGKRIARLGWLRDDAWTPYCKRLREGK